MTKRDKMILSYLRWEQREVQQVVRRLGYSNHLGFKRDRDIDFNAVYDSAILQRNLDQTNSE